MDILHFLKEKGHRMTKKDLLNFIESRTGSVWDDFRQKIKRRTQSPKEKTKMDQFLKKGEKNGKEDKK